MTCSWLLVTYVLLVQFSGWMTVAYCIYETLTWNKNWRTFFAFPANIVCEIQGIIWIRREICFVSVESIVVALQSHIFGRCSFRGNHRNLYHMRHGKFGSLRNRRSRLLNWLVSCPIMTGAMNKAKTIISPSPPLDRKKFTTEWHCKMSF